MVLGHVLVLGQRDYNLIIAGFLSIWGRYGTKTWSGYVLAVRESFQMYMGPNAA